MNKKNKLFWILVLFLTSFVIFNNLINGYSGENSIIKPYTYDKYNFGLKSSGLTYDFDFADDVIGNDPIGWIITEGGAKTVSVVESVGAQSMVLEFAAGDAGTLIAAKIFEEATEGVIRLKYRNTNTPQAHQCFLRIADGSWSDALELYVQYSDLMWSGGKIIDDTFLSNTWYWIEITFDCASTWSIEVRLGDEDGALLGSSIGLTYLGSPSAIDRIEMRGFYADNTIHYFDDFDLSWTWELYDDVSSPTWDNHLEFYDPLEIGNNITVWIDVYDKTNLSFVYLEWENVNYSMSNNSNTYSHSWTPTQLGINYYKIYMIDPFGHTTLLEGAVLVQNSYYLLVEDSIYSIMSVLMLIFLMFFMIVVFLKFKVFLIVLGISLFSIIIGAYSIVNYTIPFTPIFQTMFIIFQTIFLLLTSIETFKKDFKKEVK